MAEKQKGASSSTNSKEKTSLLDLDIGKDFLTSWKSMSVTEDDSMDFDFSKVAKGQKKTFNFDDVDMDFTLDGDFGKISSFKVDISDLDVSSPVKKAGKPKERSKEVSADGKLQGKSDRFTFRFDFNEFDSLNFESSLMKKDGQSNKNQDAEKSSSQSGSQGSGIHLKENIGALEDNIFLKHGASEGETTSKFDGQLGRKLDSPNKDELLKSLIKEKCLSKSTSEDVVGGARTSPEKSISCSTHETDQESCPPEKITSPESYTQETCKDVSVQSVSENLSTQDTATDLQEEVGSQAKIESTGTGGDQHVILKQNDSGFNYENAQLDNLQPDMVCSKNNNGEKRKFEGDNHVQIGYKDGAEPVHGDSQFEQTSITTVSGELLPETEADGEILDSTSELIASPLNIGTTGDKAMSDKESETAIRSKYFNRSGETKSQLQQASLSQIKLTTFGSKRIGAAQQTPVNESRKLRTKDAQSESKLVGIPTSLSRELTRGEPVQIRNQGSIKDLTSNSGAFNVDNAGSTLTGTSRLHDNDLTGELVLSGTENNVKGFNTFSSHVLLSSLNEQANKSSSQNCQNPRLPVSGMKSIQNTKNNSAEKNKLSPVKGVGRTSDPSKLKNTRTTGSNYAPLKSTLQKDIISLTNSERSMALKGNTESRMAHAADTKKRTSSSPTLKRKSLEEASAGLLTLKPMKRLSQSPGESRNSRESSQIIVDKQICNNENLADGTEKNVFNNHQSPRLHTPQEVNMNELETPLTMENNTVVEKAEACAKELEDICSMLKKKHEEAKEILVRAVVSNNNLLMLNHPIYEEKICMIQKFAASLMSKYASH